MKYYHQPRSEILQMRVWEFFAYLEQIDLIENPEKAKQPKKVDMEEFKKMIGV